MDRTERSENITENGFSARCKEYESCYTLWQQDLQVSNESATTTMLAQGCWDASSNQDCLSSNCVSTKPPVKAKNNTKFCCCAGDLCNTNFTDGYVLQPDVKNDTGLPLMETAKLSNRDITINVFSALVFLLLLITILMVFGYRPWNSLLENNPLKKNLDSVHLVDSQTCQSFSSSVDFGKLKIEEIIGNGRFGSVCKGVLNDQLVAVKTFNCHNRQYFLNERDIYMLPHMDHPSILKFIGVDDKCFNKGNSYPEYHIVFNYLPMGCLQDFLRKQTVDWSTMCRMTQSISAGLSHLHSETHKGDKHKPCVAHRDLSSRNILVKEDHSCVICDFGFSMQIAGSKCFVNGVEQNAETTSLSDVGTLRYMAPEILEGAVNLRDCESSLKQIDVYALGLIIWETASRCTDLYQGMEVPPYKQPFEHEVGLSPSYEQMQVLVTRHKARPLFPDIWKDTNPAIRALKETIEDCWDHDAEARLTALCVYERLQDLPSLWERHKAGTVSAAVGSHLGAVSQTQTIANINNRNVLNVRNGAQELHSKENVNEKLTNKQNDTHGNNSETGETVISCCDLEKNMSTAAFSYPLSRVTLPLQPYQGRNPCLERNLMVQPSDDVMSNKYLVDGFKFRSTSSETTLPSPEMQDLSSTLESQSLVSSDVLSRTTNSQHMGRRAIGNPHTVISQIQNNIKNPIPKQPNVPGNGHHSIPALNEYRANESWPSKILKLWTKSNSGYTLRQLFERRKRNRAMNECDRCEAEPLSSGQQCVPNDTTVVVISNQETADDANLKETKVYLVNGSPTTSLVNSNCTAVDSTEVSSQTVPKMEH
ncbi:bone morphogenetic protein receptor type-2-like protein [Leptotrombidium deliense]|uniref:Serine/threonine-protein kinase receptor n=1 Tax=Leptotrombidium deliense TaxID=299467 RepID=A0A443SW23_9ACAR|nr:bone morphogenetic protein receptor type-2-like protein [Leptotrombidium deliense]